MVYGYKNEAQTETLLEALIARGVLFMKTKGTLEDGVYKLPINYKVDIFGDDEFNQIYNHKHYGGNVNFEFVYDSNDCYIFGYSL